MQTTTPMVPAFSSIPPALLYTVSGGCPQCPQQQCPQLQSSQPPVQQNQFNYPQYNMMTPGAQQPAATGPDSSGGPEVSIVINGVPQTGR
jgi:hypothetical protein